MAVEGLCPEQFKAQTRAAMRTSMPLDLSTRILDPPYFSHRSTYAAASVPTAFRKMPQQMSMSDTRSGQSRRSE